jgi:hypothetical protein
MKTQGRRDHGLFRFWCKKRCQANGRGVLKGVLAFLDPPTGDSFMLEEYAIIFNFMFNEVFSRVRCTVLHQYYNSCKPRWIRAGACGASCRSRTLAFRRTKGRPRRLIGEPWKWRAMLLRGRETYRGSHLLQCRSNSRPLP